MLAVAKLLSWTVGLFLVLLSLLFLFIAPIAIVSLVLGLVLLPPIQRLVHKRLSWEYSPGIKWLIGGSAIIVLLIAVVNADSPPAKSLESTSVSKIIAPAQLLLPDRKDVDSEFKTGLAKNLTPKDIPGYEEGATMEYSKVAGSTGIVTIDFTVMKFQDTSSANAYHESEISLLKQKGGYEEISEGGRSCFSFKEDYGILSGVFATSNCVHGNIAYQVAVSSVNTFKSPRSSLRSALDAIENKIK